jgi:hypothetical protein
MFIATLCTLPKLWNQLRCRPTDEWIKKSYIKIHICMYI